MQQDASPPRVLSLMAVPLTLRALFACTTIGDPSLVDHAQAAIPLLSALLEEELLPCWATHRAIRMERKIPAGVTSRFPGPSDDRWVVALRRHRPGLRGAESRGELGGTYRPWFEMMAQFQSQIPHPLGHDIPGLLPRGGVTAPPIGVKFLVFIS